MSKPEQVKAPFRMHLSVTPRYLLAKDSESFCRSLNLKPGDEENARETLKEMTAKGYVLPVGECDNFDSEKGCLGHPMKGESR